MKWTINRKLLGGFSVVILILILIIGVSFYKISSVDKNYSFLLQDRAMKAIDAKDLQVAAKNIVVYGRGYLLTGNEKVYQEYTRTHEEFQKKYENLLGKLSIPEHIQMLKDFQQIEQEYNQLTNQQIELKRQNNEAYLTLSSSKGGDIVKRFDEQAEKLAKYQIDLLEEGNQDNTKTVKNTKMQIIILGLIAILIAIVTALFMGRLISKPVTVIAESATRIATGDLTVDEIQVKNKDEIGDLAHTFNHMVKNLRNLIEQVSFNSVQVAASAEQLTASAEQTTQATNQIAMSIQQVASGAEEQGQGANESTQAMREMATGIQQVATSTSDVSELAAETSREAINGNQSIQKVIYQMDTINEVVDRSASFVKDLGEHSNEIGNIIEVITSIANQTNLLALNAAIEAARAGDHGRGFAVVADEVKKLAEQSKESANQISGLIQRIQGDTVNAVEAMEKGTHEVKLGIDIVHEAEKGFQKIHGLIEQVTTQIQEASAISEEMSASVEEVNATVEEIARIAQISANNTQNVASASEEQLASMQEISSSANALSKLAEELQLQVSQFKM